jgi:hypothetical protein
MLFGVYTQNEKGQWMRVEMLKPKGRLHGQELLNEIMAEAERYFSNLENIRDGVKFSALVIGAIERYLPDIFGSRHVANFFNKGRADVVMEFSKKNGQCSFQVL